MTRGHADVVVVAAGASQRFGSDKLEATFRGRPVLAWTLEAIGASALVERIIVVTSSGRLEHVRSAPWLGPKVVAVVPGGARRLDSVIAGLAAVAALDPAATDEGGDRVVLVHDGARPLVTTSVVDAVVAAVREHGAAVPIVPIVETVKRVAADGRVVETLDRSELGAAQTPQGATLGRFQQALDASVSDPTADFTDEAALLEACRIAVHAIPGDPTNLKVTLPADLSRAGSLLDARRGAAGETPNPAPVRPLRVGVGSDQHPFGPDDGLALGGMVIRDAPRLHGHSDGDVVLHAVADALLGAAGLGDLGRIFPADPSTPRGIASEQLVAEVLRRIHGQGFAVANLDCTVVAARPRLARHLGPMATRIADLVGADPASVNVKASTGNLDGMEGAGRGISATAVVTLEQRSAAASSSATRGDR